MSFQTVKLPTATAPSQPRLKVEKFLGVDTTTEKLGVMPYRSTQMLNFEPIVKGAIGKRKGTQRIGRFGTQPIVLCEPFCVTVDAVQRLYYMLVCGTDVVITDDAFGEVTRFAGAVAGTQVSFFAHTENRGYLLDGTTYQQLKFQDGVFSLGTLHDTFETVSYTATNKASATVEVSDAKHFVHNGATIPILYKIKQNKVEVEIDDATECYIDCDVAATGQSFNMLTGWVCISNEHIQSWYDNNVSVLNGAPFFALPNDMDEFLPYEETCDYTTDEQGHMTVTSTWMRLYGYNQAGEKVYLERDPINGYRGTDKVKVTDGYDWCYTTGMRNDSYVSEGNVPNAQTYRGCILNIVSIREKLGLAANKGSDKNVVMDTEYIELFLEYVPAWWKLRTGAFEKLEKNISRINGCDVGVRFGVASARDRLFLAGCKELANYEWYSEIDDFANFPELNYLTDSFATTEGGIMGFAMIGDKLATVCKDNRDGTNVFLKSGEMADDKAVFVTAGSYQTIGAISKRSFATASNEPLYLTAEGVYALTPSDVFGERLAQKRSYYCERQLLAHSKHALEQAVAVAHQNHYWLAVEDTCYLIDTTQPSVTDGVPFTHRQYECFVLKFPFAITSFMVHDDVLYFGCDDGVLRKYTDAAYLDDFELTDGAVSGGVPIACRWDSFVFAGKEFYNRKTVKKLSVLLSAKSKQGCRLLTAVDGGEFEQQIPYGEIDADDVLGQYLKVYEKIKLKKINTMQIRFEHDKESFFAIHAINIDYVEVQS